jgi:peptidyl-prolyl cis-trans isomerase-like 4
MNAYLKMNNVVIDDRRIQVDFSQSVSKLLHRNKHGSIMQPKSKFGGDTDKKRELLPKTFT